VDAVTARPRVGLRRPSGSAEAREGGALGGGTVILSPGRNPGEGSANDSIVAEMDSDPNGIQAGYTSPGTQDNDMVTLIDTVGKSVASAGMERERRWGL
jgi:hypothetical protein